MTNDALEKDSIFRIGKVISVDGRTVRVAVDKSKNSSHLLYQGTLVKNVAVGSYIKIIKGFTCIVCKVEGEYTNEDTGFQKRQFKNEKDKINRTLKLSLLGFFEGDEFERGIKELPLIDNECYLLDRSEFEAVHNFIKPGDRALRIGVLSQEKGQDICVGIDSLFASHIGIFGNTGSGKSYTLAKLYYELFKLYKGNPKFIEKAKFFLLDFNGEYVGQDPDCIIVEPDFKAVFKLSTNRNDGDKFPLPQRTIHDPDFWKVILQATDKTQGPFLKRAIEGKKFSKRLNDEPSILGQIEGLVLSTLSKNDRELSSKFIFEFLSDLLHCFPNSNILDVLLLMRGKLQYHNKNGCFMWVSEGQTNFDAEVPSKVAALLQSITLGDLPSDPLDKLRLQIVFQYYDEIVKGYANREHLGPLMKRMESRFNDVKAVLRLVDEKDSKKTLTIVSLKDVSIEMKKIIPLLLCKHIYEEQKSKGSDNSYLNIIVDEAHNILSEDSFRETKDWKDYRLETFEEIIKEGRKFGVFLTLASQRPSDISATIISQLHNYFLHRLINSDDILAVEKTVSYLDRVSFDSLPILPTGACVLAGLAAQVPVVIDIGPIETAFEPNNKTIGLVSQWQE